MKKILLIALLLFPSISLAEGSTPAGWESIPSESGVTQGDFDGNGTEDIVNIFASKKDKKIHAVFASLIQSGGSIRNVEITQFEKSSKINLDVLPGKMIPGPKVGCIKGETDAGDDRAKDLCDSDCNCKNLLTKGDVIKGSAEGSEWFWFFENGKFKMIWGKM